MASFRLRSLLTRTLRASLAAPLVLMACGVGDPREPPYCSNTDQLECTESPGVDLLGYNQPTCTNFLPALYQLHPATPLESIQLRAVTTHPDETVTTSVVSSLGTPCYRVLEPAACRSAYEKLRSSQGFHQVCDSVCRFYYLVTTQDDQVTAHTTLDELRRYLAPIDTAAEAVLLAYAQGLELNCDSGVELVIRERKYGAVKENFDGTFHVIGTEGHTCGPGTNLYQVVLEVAPSGGITEIQRTLLKRGDPHCAMDPRPDGPRAAAGMAETAR